MISSVSNSLNASINQQKITLKRANNGLLYPVSAKLADKGAKKSLSPVAKSATGPSWYPKGNSLVEFESGNIIHVNASDDALFNLIKSHKNIAFTKSEKGSIIIWDGEQYEIPAYKAKPIDSTGAGDMYAGGLFYGLIHSNSIELAGKLGSIAASKVVSQHGARLKSSHTDLVNEIFSTFK